MTGRWRTAASRMGPQWIVPGAAEGEGVSRRARHSLKWLMERADPAGRA